MISIIRCRTPLFCFATLMIAACSTPTAVNDSQKRESLALAEYKAAPHVLAVAPVSAARMPGNMMMQPPVQSTER